MTYNQLLKRVIEDGIEAAKRDYADDESKLRGAIAGFEACRDKTPIEILHLHTEAAAKRQELFRRRPNVVPDEYWRWRCYEVEIEWVCNVLSVGLQQQGQRVLLAHLPTARGAMKYAEIVGVQGSAA